MYFVVSKSTYLEFKIVHSDKSLSCLMGNKNKLNFEEVNFKCSIFKDYGIEYDAVKMNFLNLHYLKHTMLYMSKKQYCNLKIVFTLIFSVYFCFVSNICVKLFY